MKVQRTITFTVICFGLFFSVLFLSAPATGQATDSLQWGTTVNSLQMSVSISDSQATAAPELQFIIRNVGEKDTILNLGMMLGNGKVQLPDKISFILTDDNGKSRKFDFFDGRYAAIAGRVDDYIVPLRSGSMYGLKIGMDKFYSSSTNEMGSKLPSGRYQLIAQFEGEGTEIRNLIINSWKGKLQSNTLSIEK